MKLKKNIFVKNFLPFSPHQDNSSTHISGCPDVYQTNNNNNNTPIILFFLLLPAFPQKPQTEQIVVVVTLYKKNAHQSF